jgi:hypothetical protein
MRNMMALKATNKTPAKSTRNPFKPKSGKSTFAKIDNVFTKSLNQFSKSSIDDVGDQLLSNTVLKNVLKTNKANDVANTDSNYDPSTMGKVYESKLGDHYWLELIQRLVDNNNIAKIAQNFRFSSFTVVYAVKHSWLPYLITVDGFHHLLALYINIRAGNIKGWDPEDWRDFPIPTMMWETDDQSFPLRIALEINGGSQLEWGEIEHLRCKSAIARLFPKYAKSEDVLALQQVMVFLNEGHSVPLNKKSTDVKYKESITHINAIVANKDINRLKYIAENNYKHWPQEKRSSAMFGFYGNIFDLLPNITDTQMNDYCYIIEKVFGNLEKAKRATMQAMKKLTALSNDNWKPSGGDNALLAVVEIIYKDYMHGSKKVTGSKGSYVYTNSKNVTINVVDALRKLPNSVYAKKIDSL